MSSQCLKINFGSELRKLYQVPKSLFDLQIYIKEVYGLDFYYIEYSSKANTLVRIATEQDYQCYCLRNKSLKILRIVISDELDKPNEGILQLAETPKISEIEDQEKKKIPSFTDIHEGVTCFECKVFPIAGTRFKCICCLNFDLCELCEDIIFHDHPLLKLASPLKCYQNSLKIVSVYSSSDWMPGLKDLTLAKPKDPSKQKYKLKVKNYLFKKNQVIAINEPNEFAWELVNKGTKPWLAGTKLVLKKGGFSSETQGTDIQVEPGGSIIVKAIVTPTEVKEFSGVWELESGGKKFGKIAAQFTVTL